MVSNVRHVLLPGVILEMEGSIRQTCNRTLFSIKNCKREPLINPYFHRILTMFLIKQIFEKELIRQGNVQKPGAVLA